MSKAYKYRGGRGILDKDGNSIFERDVTTLVNNQLYLPTKDNLNDPTEGLYGDDALLKFFNAFSEYSHNVGVQYNKFTSKFSKVGVYSLGKSLKDDYNIKEFYLATISNDQQEPILKIFCYTKMPSAPVKSFEFIIDINNEVVRVK